MTVAEALDLKVNFFGSHSGSYSGSDLVYVDDYMVAGDPCMALDGKTKLLYGQAARITFVMKSFKAAGSLNFAVVAANASVSGESNAIEVDSLGLPASVKLALEDVKSVASGGLDVKNYSDFNNKVIAADKLAITDGPNGTVYLLGKVLPDNLMTVSAARVYAMVWIRDTGEGCEKAISAYPNVTPEIEATIRDTYNSVTRGCRTNADGIAKAKAFLQALKIKAR